MNDLYETVSLETDLGKEDPAFGTMSKFEKNQEWYFGIRFFFTDQRTGELRPGRNGISVQAGYAVQLIETLIATYNLATGNEYVLATADQIKEEEEVIDLGDDDKSDV
jgi:hypothetical protein